MIVKKVYFNDFLEEFKKHGRENQFSYEGKKSTIWVFEPTREDLGKPIQLDIIALCCEFTWVWEFKRIQRWL